MSQYVSNNLELQYLEIELQTYIRKLSYMYKDQEKSIQHLNNLFPPKIIILPYDFWSNYLVIKSQRLFNVRNKIHFYRNTDHSIRDIAKIVKKSPNTVQAELKKDPLPYILDKELETHLENLLPHFNALKNNLEAQNWHLI